MMNKKQVLFLIGVAVFLILIVNLPLEKDSVNSVCVGETCFEVEIVDSLETRARGLMFRESLDENKGMWFVFEESKVYPFWMKNTLIPLDMIWVNENFEIVAIIENAVPCEVNPCEHYNPGTEALYVLEINGGLASELNLGVGDIVSVNN